MWRRVLEALAALFAPRAHPPSGLASLSDHLLRDIGLTRDDATRLDLGR